MVSMTEIWTGLVCILHNEIPMNEGMLLRYVTFFPFLANAKQHQPKSKMASLCTQWTYWVSRAHTHTCIHTKTDKGPLISTLMNSIRVYYPSFVPSEHPGWCPGREHAVARVKQGSNMGEGGQLHSWLGPWRWSGRQTAYIAQYGEIGLIQLSNDERFVGCYCWEGSKGVRYASGCFFCCFF